MRLNLPLTDIEFPLDEAKTIVSTTDLNGNIEYANGYFVEVSGFTEQELIGQPQNILRHPDMPETAFADLWKTVKAGLPWRGLVKNRQKNGGYYWVLANVTPVIENGKPIGYMSVRTKPSRAQVDMATKLYAQEKAKPGSVALCQGQPVKSGLFSGGLTKSMPLGMRVQIMLGAVLAATGLLGAAAVAPQLFADIGYHGWQGGLAAMSALFTISFWYFLVRHVVGPIKAALKTAQAMAGGDLTTEISTTRIDDIGQLIRAMAQLNTNLHSIVGDIRLNFEDIVQATRQLASGNVDLSARTDSQAAALEETAASMEELTSAVKQNADNSTNGDKAAALALNTTNKGAEIVNKVVTTIAEISESSSKISDIVGLINGIASQTNLLALNAAVEAARAGEAGRGFAVVATEVRSLAQRSAQAATEIRQLIETSVEKVNTGTVLANDAGTAMQEILGAVNRVTALISDISSASVEQSTGIGQVNEAVTQMDEVTQQNAALVEEASAATSNLEQQGNKLMQALEVFKLHSKNNASGSEAGGKGGARAAAASGGQQQAKAYRKAA